MGIIWLRRLFPLSRVNVSQLSYPGLDLWDSSDISRTARASWVAQLARRRPALAYKVQKYN